MKSKGCTEIQRGEEWREDEEECENLFLSLSPLHFLTLTSSLLPLRLCPPRFHLQPEGVLAPVAHVPAQMLEDRIARITIPTRNVMQSGSSKLDRWVVNWDTEERWENPLMGWISS